MAVDEDDIELEKSNLDLRKAPTLIFSCKHGKFSRVLFCYFVAKKSKIAGEKYNTGVMSGGRCFAFCLYRSRSFAQNANILRRSAVFHSAATPPEMLSAFLSTRMRPPISPT